MWLLILVAMALIGAYNAQSPAPGQSVIVRTLALDSFLLLCVSLMIGPLSTLWPDRFAQLIEPRRAVGIASFVFMAAHGILAIALMMKFNLNAVFGNPDLLIAVPALLLYLALALTSSNWAVSTLGNNNWKNLHRLTYLAFLLVLGHFLLKSNGLWRGANNLNLSEVALVALGAATVILQIIGLNAKIKRKEDAITAGPRKEPETKPSVPPISAPAFSGIKTAK
jgi:DMSO/TMAO reductase YedYZ heme-binding membrane subunit